MRLSNRPGRRVWPLAVGVALVLTATMMNTADGAGADQSPNASANAVVTPNIGLPDGLPVHPLYVSYTLNAMPTQPMTLAQIEAKSASDAQVRLAQDAAAQAELSDLASSGVPAKDDPSFLDDPNFVDGQGLSQAAASPGVASGHLLYDATGWQDAFHYHSKEMWNLRYICDRDHPEIPCPVTDAVAVKFFESILGGSSHKWIITTYRRRVQGVTPFKSPLWIACAVNIKGAPDVYCPDWRDDGADESDNRANFGNGQDYIKDFGSFGSGKKYPILTLATLYADQTHSDKAKFRGWDMCVVSRTDHRLCGSTGTGG